MTEFCSLEVEQTGKKTSKFQYNYLSSSEVIKLQIVFK